MKKTVVVVALLISSCYRSGAQGTDTDIVVDASSGQNRTEDSDTQLGDTGRVDPKDSDGVECPNVEQLWQMPLCRTYRIIEGTSSVILITEDDLLLKVDESGEVSQLIDLGDPDQASPHISKVFLSVDPDDERILLSNEREDRFEIYNTAGEMTGSFTLFDPFSWYNILTPQFLQNSSNMMVWCDEMTLLPTPVTELFVADADGSLLFGIPPFNYEYTISESQQLDNTARLSRDHSTVVLRDITGIAGYNVSDGFERWRIELAGIGIFALSADGRRVHVTTHSEISSSIFFLEDGVIVGEFANPSRISRILVAPTGDYSLFRSDDGATLLLDGSPVFTIQLQPSSFVRSWDISSHGDSILIEEELGESMLLVDANGNVLANIPDAARAGFLADESLFYVYKPTSALSLHRIVGRDPTCEPQVLTVTREGRRN